MKIAMVGQKGLPALHGGIERHVHDLSLRLVKSGFEVLGYCRKWYTNREDGDFEGVKLIHVPTLRTKHFDAIVGTLFATLDAIRRKVDVIHYHGVGPSLLSWIPRLLSPKTLVIATFHCIDRKHQKWGRFARLSLRLGEWAACKFPHKTIAVSRPIADYMREVYNTQGVYIPNAVNIPELLTDTEALQKWNLSPKEYIMVVSRLIPHKGIHYIIEAWKNILAKNPEKIGNKKLVIVGDGYYTDDYVAFVKDLAKETPSIIFTGFQSGKDLQTIFSHAKLMVHPSDNEGLPIAVLEGMSYQLPVLVSNIIEHKDLIDNPDFLFSQGNIESLSEKLSFLLSQEKEFLNKEVVRNSRVIEQEFEWSKVLGRIIDMYEKPVSSTKIPTVAIENQ